MFFPHVPPLWIFIPGAVCFLALVGWLYLRGVRGARGRFGIYLPAIRGAVAVTILFCLLDPVYRFYKERELKSVVAILVDDSASMAISDMPDGLKRIERARRAVFGPEGNLSALLSREFRVRPYAFAGAIRELSDPATLKATGDRTDFARALTSLLGRLGNETVSAVVLLSDGADNGPIPPSRILSTFREQGIPIYSIGCGSSEEARDIAVDRIITHRKVSIETEVTLAVYVRSHGYAGATVPLVLRRGGVEERHAITLKDGEQRFEMQFKPTEEGLLEYEVFIPPQPGELLTENNRQSFAVNASRHKLKVLYMEGTQYRMEDRQLWEFQYLVQALEEDKDIQVTAMLRDDVRAAERAGVPYVRHPTRGFPRTRKELFEYDVIICSDVDIVYFTEEQLKNTVDFVAQHGGGYAMVGGYTAFGTGGYDESLIDKLLPVDMQGRDDGYTENIPFRWVLTREAATHPIMQLDPDPRKNQEIWDKMPYFKGFNHVLRAKPGATVLAVHPERRTLFGANVLLAVQEYGKGRTMAFVTDTTAGWGEDFEAKWGEGGDNRYFRKFWQNAVRWLASYRFKSPKSPILLHTDSNRHATGDRARLWAEVWDDDYNPTHAAKVWLEVRSPDGHVTRERMEPDLRRPGEYTVEVALPAKGRYEFIARSFLHETEKGSDIAQIVVEDPDYEYRHFHLDRAFLARIAEETGGEYLTLDRATQLPERLAKAAHLDQSYIEKSWWNNPYLLAALLGLLALEWFLRRLVGLP